MAILEFTDQVAVKTPVGDGYALFVETTAQDYFWTVVLDNGAFVTLTQDRIRAVRCYTRRRGLDDDEMRAIIACRKSKRGGQSRATRVTRRRR
jgi:hypothetical protein